MQAAPLRGTQQGRLFLQGSRALAVPLPAAAPRPGRQHGTAARRGCNSRTRATWFAQAAEAIVPPLWFLPQCRDGAHGLVDNMCQLQVAVANVGQGLLQALQALLQAACAALSVLAATLQQWAANISTAVNTSSTQGQPNALPTQATAPTAESHAALKDVVPRRVDMRPDPPALSANSSHLSSFWGSNWTTTTPSSSSTSSSSGGMHLVHAPQVVATHHRSSRGRTWFNGASEDRATDELGFAAGATSEDVTTFLDAEGSAQQQAAAAARRKQQQRQLPSYWAQPEQQQQQQQQQVYQVEAGQSMVAGLHLRVPQVGWGHLAALGVVGWMGWRLGQRVATRAKERAQQSVVEGQLQQQALAEALAEQRARMRRALAPKDASSSSSAQQRAAALEENLEADCMPPPVAGVLPRAASPALQPVAGMDKEALAAFQKFLESSGMAGVSRDKIWVKETAEEQPKGSAEQMQLLTDKLRQAVDASDLDREQAGDKAALAELLGQSDDYEGEQAAAGGGWEDAEGSSGAARHRRARSPSLEGQEGSSYSSWEGAGGQGGEGRGRRSVSPTEELRSGSRSPAAEEEDDDFNPFALTAEAREKWEADDHLYTSAPKSKGFGWGNKKKAQPKRRSPSPQQPRRRRPLAEFDYEFALPKKPAAADNSSSSSSSENGAAMGTAGGLGQAPADPWGSNSSSSSSSSSSSGRSTKTAANAERPQMPAVAAAAAEEDLQQVTPALGTAAGKRLRGKQQPAAAAAGEDSDALPRGEADVRAAAAEDDQERQQQQPKPRPMRIRK